MARTNAQTMAQARNKLEHLSNEIIAIIVNFLDGKSLSRFMLTSKLFNECVKKHLNILINKNVVHTDIVLLKLLSNRAINHIESKVTEFQEFKPIFNNNPGIPAIQIISSDIQMMKHIAYLYLTNAEFKKIVVRHLMNLMQTTPEYTAVQEASIIDTSMLSESVQSNHQMRIGAFSNCNQKLNASMQELYFSKTNIISTLKHKHILNILCFIDLIDKKYQLKSLPITMDIKSLTKEQQEDLKQIKTEIYKIIIKEFQGITSNALVNIEEFFKYSDNIMNIIKMFDNKPEQEPTMQIEEQPKKLDKFSQLSVAKNIPNSYSHYMLNWSKFAILFIEPRNLQNATFNGITILMKLIETYDFNTALELVQLNTNLNLAFKNKDNKTALDLLEDKLKAEPELKDDQFFMELGKILSTSCKNNVVGSVGI